MADRIIIGAYFGEMRLRSYVACMIVEDPTNTLGIYEHIDRPTVTKRGDFFYLFA